MTKLCFLLSSLVMILASSTGNSWAVDINNPYVKPLPPRMVVPSPQYRTGQPRQPYNPSPIEVPARQQKLNGQLDIKHIEWCNNQYQSYKRTDNTYIPLGGGQRRSCSSPFYQP
ncbi:BA14K family protein [Bartonella sp. HY761]|uniref:BA14K family protein n=1 Tax=Bartonella sp. HY761 TaxID=2979330 RepID=UPI0021FC6528|nr:BA14K family protein [Bartonella sp. HY761]UXN05453.1 BA14K family protein [Bartonella sp. HY761]